MSFPVFHNQGAIPKGDTYEYLRYYTVTKSGTFIALHRLVFQFEGSDVSPENMTSNTAPSPYVADASSEFSSAWEAWEAFEGGTTEAWSDSGGSDANSWCEIYLGSGNGVEVDAVLIHPDAGFWPTRFKIEGSNNGTDWTELYDSGTTSFTNDTAKTFSFT